MPSGAVLLPRALHYRESAYRERIIEHKFLGSLLPEYWRRNWPDRIEVSKPEVDNAGYDLVLEANGITRHVQLKSSVEATGVVPVNRLLEDKPLGCVVWMKIDANLNIAEFRWFGSQGRMPPVSEFPKLSGNRYRVPIGRFEKLGSIQDVMDRLFG